MRLATENGKNLTLTPLGEWHRFIGGVERTVYCWVVDSIKGDRQRFHDVEIYFDGTDWIGECDSVDNEPDDRRACEANRLGGRLCSHLSRCLLELEDQNKLMLSFVGECAECRRDNVRVAWDGEAYICVDTQGCLAARVDAKQLILEQDRKDIFGDA